MYAITTKQCGPTNHRGTVIQAVWKKYDGQKVQVIMPYDHAMSVRDNHAAAAMKLARMHTDDGNDFMCGETEGGYVFVMCGETFTRYFGKQGE